MKVFKILVICVCSLLGLSSCNSKKGTVVSKIDFNNSLNKIRKSVGIPIISNKWLLKNYPNDSLMYEWRPPRVKDFTKPFHMLKATWFDFKNNKLLEEEDVYFYELKKNLSYTLVLHYKFGNINEWFCEFMTHKEIEKYEKKDFFVVATDTISINQADSILLNWGLSRFQNGISID